MKPGKAKLLPQRAKNAKQRKDFFYKICFALCSEGFSSLRYQERRQITAGKFK
jgi:hypothetical protein